MERVYVGLGANLGERAATLADAIEQLDEIEGTRVMRCSALYETAAVGFTEQPDFVNCVAELATELAPHALLHELQGIEERLGRTRSIRNGPRTCDLDLLLYGDRVIDEPGLHVPHPRLHERRFVLDPLAELAVELRLPDGRAVSDLLAAAAGQKVVRYVT